MINTIRMIDACMTSAMMPVFEKTIDRASIKWNAEAATTKEFMVMKYTNQLHATDTTMLPKDSTYGCINLMGGKPPIPPTHNEFISAWVASPRIASVYRY